MLNLLDVKGKTITADAMHCQKATCKKIIDAGGHYVLGLKENQKTLFNDVSLFINSPVNVDCIEMFTTSEKAMADMKREFSIRLRTSIG